VFKKIIQSLMKNFGFWICDFKKNQNRRVPRTKNFFLKAIDEEMMLWLHRSIPTGVICAGA